MRQASPSAEGEGANVEEATANALAALGVTGDQARVEVVDPGRKGLFGGRRQAHVRATLIDGSEGMPDAGDNQDNQAQPPTAGASEPAYEQEVAVADTDTQAAQPEDGTDETTHESSGRVDQRPDRRLDTEELTPEQWVELLDEEADLAADFVEGLLDRLDLPGDIEIEVAEQQAFVTVQDVGSGLLIGRRGATLDALQELVRCAVQRQTERRSHVRVDVEGYRARQLDKLRDKCREAIAQVRETGKPVRLEPMDAYERKLMHDLAGKTGGVTSSSEGNEPRRRVVIHPTDS